MYAILGSFFGLRWMGVSEIFLYMQYLILPLLWCKIDMCSLSLVAISITFVELENKNTNWNFMHIWG